METVIRGLIIYVVVLAAMRAAGRRSVGEMTAFDLVLLLIIAETTQQALLGDDFSLTNAIILIVTLFSIDILLSFLKERWPAADKVMDGRPTILMSDGQIDEAALKYTRLGELDLLEAARREGVATLGEVRYAVLEVNGDISIIPKK
jgi:uncharacterized membrane protein YcaP (DUF421 family)